MRDVFVRLVRSLAPGLTFEAEAPTAVEVTLFAQPERRRHVLALVNSQAEQPNLPVDGIEVRARLPRLHTLAMVALEHAGAGLSSSAPPSGGR